METIEKINIVQMKKDIKVMSNMQRFYKNQRRTDKLQGDRKISPSEANWKHHSNRENLRLMFAAYGLARGKSFSQTENKHPEEGHPLHELQGGIDRIIDGYKPKEEE